MLLSAEVCLFVFNVHSPASCVVVGVMAVDVKEAETLPVE